MAQKFSSVTDLFIVDAANEAKAFETQQINHIHRKVMKLINKLINK